MLTASSATTFAAVADAAGVECILVGDSTLAWSALATRWRAAVENHAHHTESVARGLRRVAGHYLD